MNLSVAPNTPIRTPQSKNSTKSLQLTPIWEEVVKNNRLPPEVNRDLIFKEISARLEDFEWPVRQHAFRVLYDIIPIIPKGDLDEQISRNNILEKLVVNLGHPAPGIRKVASETIQKYLKETSLTEKMLEDFLLYGMKESSLVSNNQTGLLRDNITLGTIVALTDVLKPFLIPEIGSYSLSQSLLSDIIKTLAEKSSCPVFREKCLGALSRIKEMVGDSRFYYAIDKIPERELILNLMNLGFESNWSDRNSFGVMMNQDSFEASPEEKSKSYENVRKDESSEDFSDGTDTETYTKEPAPNLEDDTIFYHVNRVEVPHFASPSFVPIEHSDNFLPKVDTNEEAKDEDNEKKRSGATSPRVVLEAEIQFAKNKAITMKLMEDENDPRKDEQSDAQRRFTTENGDLVMKVLNNNEEIDEEEKTRTPRRVRFGGEVIKLRTPDSDTTDITIEIHEGADAHVRKEPIITITPESAAEEKKSDQTELKSQIPAPLAPETRAPSREPSPSRRLESSKIPVLKENSLSPKNESFDSAPSSSGSEGDVVEGWSDDEENVWKWAELRVVEENILKDLKSKVGIQQKNEGNLLCYTVDKMEGIDVLFLYCNHLENWKIQYQALEQLKIVLINPKTIERIGKLKNQEKLNSLFKCLLHKLPQSNNHQVTTLALSIVTQLIETLPKELILLNIKDIVQGLCRYVGGCKNLNLKIEAVQSLKMLFGILEPSAVIDVLLGQGCLFSSSSKLRENSLLAIMYALMTFPSDMFDMEKILQKVAVSAADIRRRVRHGSLEAIAVLSQFCSSQTLTENIARVAETLSTPAAKAQLIAAVQARLSRRLLPTISSEGLVLYAMQIPASRRFGNLANPMGADVDWILSGTGSISTGSAKSKTQLNVAQRLEFKPSTPLSPNKWSQSSQSERGTKPSPDDNPWKIQKHRTESSAGKNDKQRSRFFKTQSTGNLNENNRAFEYNFLNVTDAEKRLRPEEITWALVPVSALEEPLLSRERSNVLWGESFGENTPHYLSPSLGPLKPMYIKFQSAQDQLILSRSSDDVRRNSFSFGNKKDLEDFTEIRLLTPTILREKNYSDNYHQNGKLQRNDARGSGEIPTRIPVLCSNTKNVPRVIRSGQYRNDRKGSDPDDTSVNQKPTKFNNASKRLNGSSAFLPSIHTGPHDSNYNIQRSPTSNRFGDVDEMKLQDTMTQLSDLLTASKDVGKSGTRDIYSIENQPEEENNGNENLQMNGSDIFVDKIQNKLFDRSYLKDHETLPNTVASAPPVISTDSRDQISSTSSSNSTDFGISTGNEPSLRRLTNNSVASSGLPYRNYSTYNSKSKGKKMSLTKNLNKVGSGNSFPDNLKPFERPKEGLDTCFNQLESQQWEVNMLGLTSLVRLLRHHPAIVLSQVHPIIVALGRQIRNLRSQVARVACQASAETFIALKRNVEPDLEELSGPLFHRSADTNRFIRADCNHALDKMVDNVGHVKAVSVIISKGTTHQNATVRAVAARLLLRLAEKAGPEKLLSLPKEIRDKMLQAGANLLIEGKLETRAFAKQVFRVWASHPSFSNLILEAVEPNVMRHISKTLISLKS